LSYLWKERKIKTENKYYVCPKIEEESVEVLKSLREILFFGKPYQVEMEVIRCPDCGCLHRVLEGEKRNADTNT